MWDSLLTIMSVIARLGMLIGTARSVRNCVLIICKKDKGCERLGRKIYNTLAPGSRKNAEQHDLIYIWTYMREDVMQSLSATLCKNGL